MWICTPRHCSLSSCLLFRDCAAFWVFGICFLFVSLIFVLFVTWAEHPGEFLTVYGFFISCFMATPSSDWTMGDEVMASALFNHVFVTGLRGCQKGRGGGNPGPRNAGSLTRFRFHPSGEGIWGNSGKRREGIQKKGHHPARIRTRGYLGGNLFLRLMIIGRQHTMVTEYRLAAINFRFSCLFACHPVNGLW